MQRQRQHIREEHGGGGQDLRVQLRALIYGCLHIARSDLFWSYTDIALNDSSSDERVGVAVIISNTIFPLVNTV